eukprot:1557474-Pyramimonas_sp.AAC.1
MNRGDTCRSGDALAIQISRRRTTPPCQPWSKTTATDSIDSDDSGRYVELCFTTEMSMVVLSEQQHMLIDADRVATMRVYVTAAAKRAVVVKEDGLLAKADIQANSEKMPKALSAELKT